MKIIDSSVEKYIQLSVLCWLATADTEGTPNVSPKEVFSVYNDHTILIANIASPQSESNIIINPKVCVAFVDILVQKGYKLHGKGQVLNTSHPKYATFLEPLVSITQNRFAIRNIFAIHIERVAPIIVPSYLFYSETTESSQIEAAKKNYKLED